MLTVVHVITRLELGGAQQNTLSTCRGLAEQGLRVALIYGPGGALDEELRSMAGVEPWSISALGRAINPARDLAAVESIRRVLARIEGGHRGRRTELIVHTHSSKAGILGRAAAAARGLRTVIHSIHGFPFFDGQNPARFRAYVAAEQRSARWTRAFISVSRANVAEAQARGIIQPRQRVEVVRSGMALAPFFEARLRRDEVRRRWEVSRSQPIFLAVANLKPQKDPLTLIRAMLTVREQLPAARLWYVGDGPLRDAVERARRELGLVDAIELLGWRRDIAELMAASDVVALSSRFEGLPRSAVQAVAAGRPFVGCRVDGTPEIIRAGRDGYLVEPGRAGDLGRAMIRAYRERPVDPDGQRRLEAWSESTLVNRQRSLYDELAREA